MNEDDDEVSTVVEWKNEEGLTEGILHRLKMRNETTDSIESLVLHYRYNPAHWYPECVKPSAREIINYLFI